MCEYITKSSFKKTDNREIIQTSIYKIIDGEEILYKTIEHIEIINQDYCQTSVKDKFNYITHSYDNLGKFLHLDNPAIQEGKHKGQLDIPFNATSIEYIISGSEYNKFKGIKYDDETYKRMRLNYFRDPLSNYKIRKSQNENA